MYWYWQRIMVICLSVSVISCKDKKEITGNDLQIPEDFREFYDQFHKDSVYQVNHIIFPLSGLPAEDSLKSDSFTWNKVDWIMHKPFDDLGGTFKREWYNVNSVIIEKKTPNH